MQTFTGCLLLLLFLTLALGPARALPAGGKKSSRSRPSSSFDSTAAEILPSSESAPLEPQGPTAVESGSGQMAGSDEQPFYNNVAPQSWYSNPAIVPTAQQTSLVAPLIFPPPRLDTIIAEKRQRRRKKLAFKNFKQRIGYIDIKPTLLSDRFHRNLTPQIVDGLLSSDEVIVQSAFEAMKPRCILTAAIDQQALTLMAYDSLEGERKEEEEKREEARERNGAQILEANRAKEDEDEGETENDELDLTLSLGTGQREGKGKKSAHTDTSRPEIYSTGSTSHSPLSKWAKENPHRKRQVYDWLCQAMNVPPGARGAKERRKWKRCLNTHSTTTNIAGLSSLDPLVVSQALRSLQNIDEQGKRGTYKTKARQT